MRRRPKLKEVFVRLEDHLECVCTSQHHVVEHSDAETGKSDPQRFYTSFSHYRKWLTFCRKITLRLSLITESCPASSCIIMLSCRPPSVSCSLSLSGSLALHWMTLSYDCSRTDRHTCEVARYCKTVKLACLCRVRRECVCESVCESVC